MKTRRVLMLAAVGVLLPVQALAGTCFTPSPFPNVLVLDGTPAGRSHFLLVGEDLGACTGNVDTGRMPLQGTAQMRGDGSVDLALSVLSPDGETQCNPYWYRVTLTPPDYAGTGFVGFLSGTKVPVSLIPTACP
jgi:hypothetical protein